MPQSSPDCPRATETSSSEALSRLTEARPEPLKDVGAARSSAMFARQFAAKQQHTLAVADCPHCQFGFLAAWVLDVLGPEPERERPPGPPDPPRRRQPEPTPQPVAPASALAASSPGRWEPIETAPKDESIVVWVPYPNGSRPGHWHPARWNDDCHAKRPQPRWKIDSVWGERWGRTHQPTHWMPLPASPREP
jgi:hypothetical protein